MVDYSSHSDNLKALQEAQEADKDNRDKIAQSHLFLNKTNGQWEPERWSANDGQPRYTFDITNPVVDQIAGEMARADFDIVVNPAGGDATKDTAALYDGLVRNIEAMSNAKQVFSDAGRQMVAGGLDGWRVVQKFVDSDSYDQDLLIEKIPNFAHRVWFEASAEMQDRSDAKRAWELTGYSPQAYKAEFPKGKALSVDTSSQSYAYYYRPELIMVGKVYYIKSKDRELALMSNGAVYAVDDDYKKVTDELKQLDVTEVDRRTRPQNIVYSRLFDTGGWLEEEKETVFEFIPLIPTYGNYSIFENKTTYWGAVEKMMDAQRVLNYSLSREIGEGALAPRAKFWGTPEQRTGHDGDLATINVNNEPWQDYNHVAGVPPPFQTGGAQINPGLRIISESMKSVLSQSAGMFASNMGDNPGLQSGVAIEKQQNKGDNGTHKYYESQEIAIAHTARILIKAIPKVYKPDRQVRILKEDGSFDMTVLSQTIFDEESQKEITINDLTQGKYDVVCSSGPAFQNRQQETVSAMLEAAQVDSTILQIGSDVFLNNITSPGASIIAERKRAQLLAQGIIPEDQMTDEEKEAAMAAAEQPQQADPALLIGEAELVKAQTGAAKEQRETMESQFNLFMQNQKMQQEQQTSIYDIIQKQAKTYEIMVNAMVKQGMITPEGLQLLSNQSELVGEAQEQV